MTSPTDSTKPKKRHAALRDFQIEAIDTEPMTPQQYDAAVTALAALINQWLATRHESRDSRNSSPKT